MKKIMKLSNLCLIVVLSIVIFSTKAQTTNYQVYSLFVMNIAKYSSWPVQGSAFHITVVGKSKAYDELMKHAATKTINGLPMKVSQIENVTDIGDAQIIYVSDGKSSMLDDILKVTQGKPVLIITEREGLYKKGAGFSFVLMDNNTLRFDINNTDLEKRQIRVAKNLTALANALL